MCLGTGTPGCQITGSRPAQRAKKSSRAFGDVPTLKPPFHWDWETKRVGGEKTHIQTEKERHTREGVRVGVRKKINNIKPPHTEPKTTRGAHRGGDDVLSRSSRRRLRSLWTVSHSLTSRGWRQSSPRWYPRTHRCLFHWRAHRRCRRGERDQGDGRRVCRECRRRWTFES